MAECKEDDVQSLIGMVGEQAIEIENIKTFETIMEEKKSIDSNSINILSLNIRSINRNFDVFMLTIANTLQNIDIIVLSEAWLLGRNFAPNEFHIQGFKSYSTIKNKNQNDGVVIYVRINLDYVVEEFLSDNVSGFIVHIKRNNKSMAIIAFYRPPQLNVHNFLYEFEQIRDIINQSDNVILLGDINIDIRKENDLSNKYKLLLSSMAMQCYNCLYTRICDNQKSCLDHIFGRLNSKSKITSFVIRNALTDHDWTAVNVNFTCKKPVDIPNGNHHTFVQFQKIKYDELVTALKQEKWYTVLEKQDLDESLSEFYQILNECIGKNTQLITSKKKKDPIKPWVTKGILVSIRNKDKLKIKVNKRPLNENLKDKYKKYRNILNTLLKTAKNNYYGKQLKFAAGNPRKQWGLLREASNMGPAKAKTVLNMINSENGEIDMETNPHLVCNTFNRHFTTVGEKIGATCLKKIKNSEYFQTNKYTKQSGNSIFLEPITTIEIHNNIDSLKGGSAPGWDSLTSELLKKISPCILEPLQHIFNLSLSQGIFPKKFKESKVILLHKKGDTKTITNYRPISLTSNLSKLLEKSIKKRLVNYVEKYKILSDNQYGFRSSKGTQNAVSDLVTSIIEETDKGMKPVLILLDIEKAFDSVSHKKLLNKLESIGIRGVALKWFGSYLNNRQQNVEINGFKSELMNMLSGIPQGTVLSPLLFLIYVNDLCNMTVEGKIFSFADDTALLVSTGNWIDTFKTASMQISKIWYWLRNNDLKMNLEKTNYITFSANANGQPHITLKIKIHNNPEKSNQCLNNQCHTCQELEKVTDARYLGVQIDQYLRWDKHIDKLKKKIRTLVHFFRIISKFSTTNLIESVYFALVQSQLQYCITAWGGAIQSHLKPLFICQKYILKVIAKKPRKYPTKLLFKDIKILKLEQLWKLEILKMAMKNNLFKSENSYYNTRGRNNFNIKTKKCNLSITYRSNHYSCIREYNKLPIELKKYIIEKTISVRSLIKRLKIHLLEEQIKEN